MSKLFKLPKVTSIFLFHNLQSNQYFTEDTIFLPTPKDVILSVISEKDVSVLSIIKLNPFNNHCCLQ